jgi:hypothetical protein
MGSYRPSREKISLHHASIASSIVPRDYPMAARATGPAQVTLKNFPSVIPGLSSTCISVISQGIACNDSISWAGAQGRFESDDTLNRLCTQACANALSTWQR